VEALPERLPAEKEAAVPLGEAPPTEAALPPEIPPRRDLAETLREQRKDRYAEAVKRDEIRTVTVLMADLSGFTAMSETMDPEKVTDTMNLVFDRLVPIVDKYDGYIDKYIGDEIMALFGAPIACEDAPERATRAAVEMQEELDRFNAEGLLPVKLGLHAGINTGPVRVGNIGARGKMQYTALGDTVNVAARLEDESETGQIFISESTWRRVKGSFELEELEPIRVKGKSEPLRVWNVKASKRRQSRLEASEQRGLAQLVGREAQMETLLDLYHRAIAGEGQIVSVIGEAGIGKSRLIYELEKVIREEDSATMVEGRCLSYGQEMPWLPFIDILNALCELDERDEAATRKNQLLAALEARSPELVGYAPYLGIVLSLEFGDVELEALEPQERRARIMEAVWQLLRVSMEQHPLVLFLDDLQWIDQSSLELLDFLLDRIPDSRILLFCVYRPDFVPHWENLAAHTEIRPARLSEEETVAMICSLLGVEEVDDSLSAVVLEKSDGNPFFIEETIKSLQQVEGALDPVTKKLRIDPQEILVPDSVEEILLSRIDRLDDAAKDTLQAAAVAVIGQTFRRTILEAIMEVPGHELEPHLATLQTHNLVRRVQEAAEEEYRFQHALTRDVAYNTLLVSKRQRLHGLAGNYIETHYQDRLEQYVDYLAFHFYRSDEAAKALAYQYQVAMRDRQNYANQEAIIHFSYALEAFSRLTNPSEEQCRIHLNALRYQGDVQWLIHDTEGALATYTQMLTAARTYQDIHAEAAALHNLGHINTQRAEYETAREYLYQALEIDRQWDNQEGELKARLGLGNLSYMLGDLDDALEQFHQALALQRQSPDYPDKPMNLWAGHNNIAAMYERKGEYQHALEACEECLHLLDGIDESMRKRAESYTQGNLGRIHSNLGNYGEALTALQRTLELTRETGERAVEAEVLCVMSYALGCLARYQEALERAQQALTLARAIDSKEWETEALARLAVLHADLGCRKEAEEMARQGLAIIEEIGSGNSEPLLHLVLGQIQLKKGHPHQALETFARALARARALKSRREEAMILSNHALALHAQGRSEEALEECHASLDMAQQMEAKRLIALGYLRKGLIHYDLGQYPEAQQSATAALVLAEALGTPDLMGTAYGLIGRCLQTDDQVDQAIEAYRKAVDALELQRDQLDGSQVSQAFLKEPDRSHVYKDLVTLLHDRGEDALAQRYVELASTPELDRYWERLTA